MERFLKALRHYTRLSALESTSSLNVEEEQSFDKDFAAAEEELAYALEDYVQERIQKAKDNVVEWVRDYLHEEKYGRGYH